VKGVDGLLSGESRWTNNLSERRGIEEWRKRLEFAILDNISKFKKRLHVINSYINSYINSSQ
jgi:hypothetical protein